MGSFLKPAAAIICSCLFLCACNRRPDAVQEPIVLVTAVDIRYNYKNTQLNRTYTNSDKMDVILYYLYGLEPYGKPDEDPEQIRNDCCHITVHLSNGRSRIYRQQGSRYLSVDFSPWKNISPTRAAVLHHLLRHIESDRIEASSHL